MFLLAAALAAFADGATARDARAATHELARRLGDGPVRTPTLGERILAFYDWVSIQEDPFGRLKTGQLWQRIEAPITAMLEAAIGQDLQEREPRCRLYRATPKQVGRAPIEGALLPAKIPIPMGDIRQIVGTRLVTKDYEPSVRTPRDELVRVLFDAWKSSGMSPYPSAPLCTEMFDNLPSIHDWMDATSPSLARMDWPAVLAASRAWHRQFRTGEAGGPVPRALVILRWPDGWTLQRLLTKADLAAEGTAMQHCVGGPDRGDGRRNGESNYWQEMRDGKIAILSLRDPNGSPEATIEVDLKKEAYQAGIQQIQGPFDEEPSEAARQHLIEAAMKLGWWNPTKPGRRLPRLGQIPVFSDDYLDSGGPLAERMERSLSGNPVAPYTVRALSNLANKKPDEFDAERKQRLLRATRETLRDIFAMPLSLVSTSGLPKDEEGRPMDGAVMERFFSGGRRDMDASRQGIVVEANRRVLTILWGQPGGLRWIVQRNLSAPGQVFQHPYDALRTFTDTYAEVPRAMLEAIEVLPGLPARQDQSGAWAVDINGAEATALRAAQGEAFRVAQAARR